MAFNPFNQQMQKLESVDVVKQHIDHSPDRLHIGFFNRQCLEEILKDTNCAGILFYPATWVDKEGEAGEAGKSYKTLIAAGTTDPAQILESEMYLSKGPCPPEWDQAGNTEDPFDKSV